MDTSISVLVIDDSPIMTRVVSQLLQKCGFKDVAQAPEVLAAFQLLRKNSFRLIICDIEMQPMNGIEFLRAIRAEPTTRDIAFVLMTATRDPATVLEANRLNVDGYLLKPFTAETLHERLSRIPKLNPPTVLDT